MIEKNCAELPDNIVTVQNYQKVAEHVLSDIDWGFFVLCEEQGTPVGFMNFSYEWSDWRNGMFYWLQTAYTKDTNEQIFKNMIEFVNSYGKEHGCCGFRLQTEKKYEEFWKPFVSRLDLVKTHYYLYHIDTV